jgi:CYTH domain-containing protein
MVNLKYALVERERRWLLTAMPDDLAVEAVGETVLIRDRYLTGTRLRLREVIEEQDGRVLKLGHKVRLDEGARAVACTSLYLDETEWGLLAALPGSGLEKRRVRVSLDGVVVAVDEFRGDLSGLVLAEIDGGGTAVPPASWPVRCEVTDDERYTGAALALAARIPVVEDLP